MILFPIRLTAATARRTAVAQELSPKPLQPCEVRNLVLKPLFIALLTIREAERLRYLCFNFKTDKDGNLIYKRVSCDLGNAIRDLKKELQKACIAIEEKNVAHRRTSSAAAECAPTTDMRSPQKADASGLHTTRHRCALRASGSNE